MGIPASHIISMREELQDLQDAARGHVGRNVFIKQATCGCPQSDTSHTYHAVNIVGGDSGASDEVDDSGGSCSVCNRRKLSIRQAGG